MLNQENESTSQQQNLSVSSAFQNKTETFKEESLRILIIEPNLHVVSLLKSWFEEWNIFFVHFTSEEEALQNLLIRSKKQNINENEETNQKRYSIEDFNVVFISFLFSPNKEPQTSKRNSLSSPEISSSNSTEKINNIENNNSIENNNNNQKIYEIPENQQQKEEKKDKEFSKDLSFLKFEKIEWWENNFPHLSVIPVVQNANLPLSLFAKARLNRLFISKPLLKPRVLKVIKQVVANLHQTKIIKISKNENDETNDENSSLPKKKQKRNSVSFQIPLPNLNVKEKNNEEKMDISNEEKEEEKVRISNKEHFRRNSKIDSMMFEEKKEKENFPSKRKSFDISPTEGEKKEKEENQNLIPNSNENQNKKNLNENKNDNKNNENNFASKKILLVEDNQTNRTVALKMLAKLGCEKVLAAENGKISVEMFEKRFNNNLNEDSSKNCDLIFMDLQMPGKKINK